MSLEEDLALLRRFPPRDDCCLPCDLDLDLLEVSCLCRRVERLGLDTLRLYRLLSVLDDGRSVELVGDGCCAAGCLETESTEVSGTAPSPADDVELVTGANTVSLLTCTSHSPVLLYLAASA